MAATIPNKSNPKMSLLLVEGGGVAALASFSLMVGFASGRVGAADDELTHALVDTGEAHFVGRGLAPLGQER